MKLNCFQLGAVEQVAFQNSALLPMVLGVSEVLSTFELLTLTLFFILNAYKLTTFPMFMCSFQVSGTQCVQSHNCHVLLAGWTSATETKGSQLSCWKWQWRVQVGSETNLITSCVVSKVWLITSNVSMCGLNYVVVLVSVAMLMRHSHPFPESVLLYEFCVSAWILVYYNDYSINISLI